MFVDIGGIRFNSDLVAVIKPVDDDDDQCVIFTAGQSAVDGGFLVDASVDEATELLNHAEIVALAKAMDAGPDAAGPDADPDHPPSIDDDAVVDLGT